MSVRHSCASSGILKATPLSKARSWSLGQSVVPHSTGLSNMPALCHHVLCINIDVFTTNLLGADFMPLT